MNIFNKQNSSNLHTKIQANTLIHLERKIEACDYHRQKQQRCFVCILILLL